MTFQDVLQQINHAENIEIFAEKNLLKLAKSGDGRYILNYDEQGLDTPKNWISHYCRGLTLAGKPQNYTVVAKSFDRFYNLNEKPEYLKSQDSIDFNQPFEVQFKYDGSIILEYLWNEKKYINTRGSFGNGQISSLSSMSWAEIFDEVKNDGEDYPAEGFTHIYELCTPYNQIVEYYQNPFIKKLGVVKHDGTEVLNAFEGFTYQCKNLIEVFELLQSLKPTQEGFVIAQYNQALNKYQRVKLKTKTWVALAHLKHSALNTDSKLWDLIFAGDYGDVISTFPALADKIAEKQVIYDELLVQIQSDFEKYKVISDRKEFAQAIHHIAHKAVLFALLDGKNLKTVTQAHIIRNYA